MAWDDIKFGGQQGFSGDKPFDAVAQALKKIASQYEDQFSRKPHLIEILHAIARVLRSSPGSYLCDEGLVKALNLELALPALPPSSAVDPADYEGAFVDKPAPGYQVVQAKSRKGVPDKDVIKVTRLVVEDRKLRCEYRILDPGINPQNAEMLIRKVLLEEFCKGFYNSKADSIEFVGA